MENCEGWLDLELHLGLSKGLVQLDLLFAIYIG